MPVDLEDIYGIIPLGNTAPSGHTFPTKHLYFHLEREIPGDFNTDTKQVDLYAPADMVLTWLSSTDFLSNGSSDYSMNFTVRDGVKMYFIHVTDLSSELKKAFNSSAKSCERYSTGGDDYRACRSDMNLKVKSGEIIGKAGGNGRNALDFGLIDSKREKNFFAGKLFKGDDYEHINCALDYYEEPLKNQLYSKLGYGEEIPDLEPLCGRVDYDVAGRARGIWLKEKSKNPYPEDKHLALVPYNLNTRRQVLSIGTSLSKQGFNSGALYFDPLRLADNPNSNVNIAFEDISSDGKVYCFETEPRFPNPDFQEKSIFLLEMLGQKSLQLEYKGTGSCASAEQSLSSEAVTFER